jgi:hypothetical protein
MKIDSEITEMIKIIINSLRNGNFGTAEKTLSALEKIIECYLKYDKYAKKNEIKQLCQE